MQSVTTKEDTMLSDGALELEAFLTVIYNLTASLLNVDELYQPSDPALLLGLLIDVVNKSFDLLLELRVNSRLNKFTENSLFVKWMGIAFLYADNPQLLRIGHASALSFSVIDDMCPLTTALGGRAEQVRTDIFYHILTYYPYALTESGQLCTERSIDKFVARNSLCMAFAVSRVAYYQTNHPGSGLAYYESTALSEAFNRCFYGPVMATLRTAPAELFGRDVVRRLEQCGCSVTQWICAVASACVEKEASTAMWNFLCVMLMHCTRNAPKYADQAHTTEIEQLNACMTKLRTPVFYDPGSERQFTVHRLATFAIVQYLVAINYCRGCVSGDGLYVNIIVAETRTLLCMLHDDAQTFISVLPIEVVVAVLWPALVCAISRISPHGVGFILSRFHWPTVMPKLFALPLKTLYSSPRGMVYW